MDDILKAAALGLTGGLCAALVRRQVPELGMVLALTVGALLLRLALNAFSGVIDFMDELTQLSGLSSGVVAPLVKTAGIAIVTKTTSALCKDAGEGGVASFVETAGAAASLFIALPLLQTVLQTLLGFLKT
ncbi:MAG: SpoIIIAC/SpoIIIAD family protein [Oscillospiraceae bacterium]|nr:SpoIIIAC/SpoIIIAD family protein [Oscillospiraceae bacterium]